MSYQDFIKEKQQIGTFDGFDPIWIPDFLFDFQKSLLEWSIKKGKGAIFADCGLGKTPMQLVWAENVVRKSNGRVLILTPLAVSHQTIKEAEKFGIEANRSVEGELFDGITVTNYERLHYFNPNDFDGIVLDESSILKSFKGARKTEITEFMKKMKYRLLCTATAAPNDYNELGTSSEALGELGYMDMLNRFFKNEMNNSATGRVYGQQLKFRLKGHAEDAFWRWVCSWARAVRRPSDLGFSDERFELPPLIEEEHIVDANTLPPGMLFPIAAIGLQEQRAERRRTIKERCEKVAELVYHGEQALVWAHLNDECNLLESIIPDAKQVKGGDTEESKESKFNAFANGELRVLVTKPKIGALGLNFQNCSHITFFPSHSFEQYYQGVRRCWRFGQEKSVKVDIVSTEGEIAVLKNLQRKARQADTMFDSLVGFMNDALEIERISTGYIKKETIPSWL